MAHYCIGNPCWICYPEHAPKQDNEYYTYWQEEIEKRKVPETEISGKVYDLLIEIFEQGLDEDTHMWAMPNLGLKLVDIINERNNVNDDSLEAALLDLLIKDCKTKNSD